MKDTSKLLATFLTGAIAGGAIGYLSQTKKGKKFRKNVKRKAKETYEDTLEALKDQKESIEESFNEAMAKIDMASIEK